MAKRFRKQISRALKRRFAQYEKQITDFSSACVCSNAMRSFDAARVSFKEFSDKIFNLLVRYVVALGVVSLFLVVFSLSSCNVTRKVTTESSFFQKGDTSCTITVKTVESYDATKKLSN